MVIKVLEREGDGDYGYIYIYLQYGVSRGVFSGCGVFYLVYRFEIKMNQIFQWFLLEFNFICRKVFYKQVDVYGDSREIRSKYGFFFQGGFEMIIKS